MRNLFIALALLFATATFGQQVWQANAIYSEGQYGKTKAENFKTTFISYGRSGSSGTLVQKIGSSEVVYSKVDYKTTTKDGIVTMNYVLENKNGGQVLLIFSWELMGDDYRAVQVMNRNGITHKLFFEVTDYENRYSY